MSNGQLHTYDRGLDEPPRVTDGIEEGKCLLHSVLHREPVSRTQFLRIAERTYDALILVKHLVIFAKRDQEDQRGDILKTVNPLLSL